MTCTVALEAESTKMELVATAFSPPQPWLSDVRDLDLVSRTHFPLQTELGQYSVNEA